MGAEIELMATGAGGKDISGQWPVKK